MAHKGFVAGAVFDVYSLEQSPFSLASLHIDKAECSLEAV